MRPTHSIEDLMALARRGVLGTDELRRLQFAIGASHESRLLYEAGLGFESEGSTQSDDDLLVSRVAERVAGMQSRRKPRRLTRTIGLAVAGLSVASVAAAGGWVLEQRIVAPKQEAASAANARQANALTAPSRTVARADIDAAAQPTASLATQDRLALTDADRSSEVDRSESPGVSAMPARKPDGNLPKAASPLQSFPPARLPSTSENTAPDAKTQYAQANRARRQSQASVAIELYRDLARRFPLAPESLQARLAAAELLLQRGDAQPALESFRSCRDGGAAAEALWGEARALRTMNRTEEERQALVVLTRRFPESPYSEAARQRLDEKR